jgi:hypothetical protein
MPETTQYYHGKLAKSQADALLEANDGFANTGKFLFRAKAASKNSFVLSVVYKGKATHHTITPADSGGLMLNGGPTGQTSLAELTK